jgi:DegV family protein with EDD domain
VVKIAYLDGRRLRTAILAGSRSIINNAEGLNAINVFPVPDGDTGTNMASTMRSIAVSLSQAFHRDAGSVMKQVARSAIEGARGNSGAILAQFLQGLAHELGSEARIGAKRLAQAAVAAAEKTKTALVSPREGTILTVLHDWAHALHDCAARSDDILHIFLSSLDVAKVSLERTRDILPEMRRAGVVDAGAKGFVHLLEGMAELLKQGRRLRPRTASTKGGPIAAEVVPFDDAHSGIPALGDISDPGGPRYCTEALLLGSSKPLDSLRNMVAGLGDSVVVAGDEDIARIHVHSDKPSAVFDLLESIGSVEQHKVDDMELQRKLATRAAAAGGGKRPCAIVVDTGCDLPEEYLLDNVIVKVPALITIGGITRPDGPAMDLSGIHMKMLRDPGFSLSTSQPTDASFARAFSIALSHADEVLYIGLSSALSGTFQAGLRAAESFGGKVRCFDSKTLTAGAGVLTAFAVELFAALGKKRREMELFVAIKDLSSLIRSGRLHGIKSIVLRKFGLKPLLGTDTSGKATNKGLYLGEKNAVQALFARVRRLIRQGEFGDIHIVHVAAREEAGKLAGLCTSLAGSGTVVQVSDMGPLLASVGWLGALGVAVLPRTQ